MALHNEFSLSSAESNDLQNLKYKAFNREVNVIWDLMIISVIKY